MVVVMMIMTMMMSSWLRHHDSENLLPALTHIARLQRHRGRSLAFRGFLRMLWQNSLAPFSRCEEDTSNPEATKLR